MNLFKSRNRWPILFPLFFLMSLLTIQANASDKVSVLSVTPYPSIGKTEGYIILSRDIKLSSQVAYYFTKCDLDMKPVKTREESMVPTETLESIAVCKTAICIAFKSMTGTLTVKSYDLQWNPLGNVVYKKENKWEGGGSIIVNGDNGFILNRITTEKNQICDFIGFDNKLNKLWEVKTNLGFDDHVWPYSYAFETDQYFYNSYSVNVNSKHEGLLISNSKDGKEVMRFDFNRPDTRLLGAPALEGAGKGNVVMAVADYVKKNKERGLLFIKMDVSTKQVTEKFVPFNTPELTGLIADAVSKQGLVNNEKGIHPYDLVKQGNQWVLVGQLYKGKAQELYSSGLSFGSGAGALVIIKFDADFNLKKVHTLENTTWGAPTYAKLKDLGNKFTSNIYDVSVVGETIKIRYINYLDRQDVAYVVATYDKEGTPSIVKKTISRGTPNTYLKVLEGSGNNLNVLRYTFEHFEITKE